MARQLVGPGIDQSPQRGLIEQLGDGLGSRRPELLPELVGGDGADGVLKLRRQPHHRLHRAVLTRLLLHHDGRLDHRHPRRSRLTGRARNPCPRPQLLDGRPQVSDPVIHSRLDLVIQQLLQASEDTSEHHRHFITGERTLTTERPIGIALDQARLGQRLDGLIGPVVAADIPEGKHLTERWHRNGPYHYGRQGQGQSFLGHVLSPSRSSSHRVLSPKRP